MPLVGPSLSSPQHPDEILNAGLAADENAVALVSTRETFTWRELEEASNCLASAYRNLGLSPGDRVASLMPNRPALVVHYLACFKAGLVATPLNYRYMPPEIDHALQVSGASLLLHHSERDEDVAASKFGRELAHGVVRYAAQDQNGSRYEELLAQGDPRAEFARPAPDAPILIFFTSGSTGLPKGVTHTHQTFGWIMASNIAALDLTAADVLLPGSSFSHIAGSMFSLAMLSAGGQVAVPRGTHAHEMLPLLRSARPTVMFMLPAALITLIRDHGAGRDDFSSLRICFAGGDKVSAELEREYTELVGCPVGEGYGMTETGHSTITPPEAEFRQGSIGKPCPGYEFCVRDDSGAELSPENDGRVWVRFPGNTIGYWNNPDATAETIVNGWLDTGDVMLADQDGYLWFHGRKKQIIVHDGSNICPQEVEEAVTAHPAIEAAGVVGVHDLVHGENVRAYVTLKPGAEKPTAEEVIQFARGHVGYKAPEEIVFLDEMPLNATGKVDRVTLKRMAEEQIAAAIGRKGS